MSEQPSPQASRGLLSTNTPRLDRELQTPVPTHIPTQTLDIAGYTNAWTRYHGNYGITLEYPSIYEESPYDERCRPVESLDGADFGENNEVFVRQPLGATLNEHIDFYVSNLHFDKPIQLLSREEIETNNRPAISVKYRLGDEVESREFVFITVPESRLIYTFSFIGGIVCDVPEIGLTERTVFEHAFETFYFEQ